MLQLCLTSTKENPDLVTSCKSPELGSVIGCKDETLFVVNNILNGLHFTKQMYAQDCTWMAHIEVPYIGGIEILDMDAIGYIADNLKTETSHR